MIRYSQPVDKKSKAIRDDKSVEEEKEILEKREEDE